MTYNVMREQAGDRLVITWKVVGRAGRWTTHFATFEEYLSHVAKEDIEYFQVLGQEKVYLRVCSLCGLKHGDGTSGNCGN